MKTRSNKTYHIVRRVGKQGTRPPRELSQLGVEKCTTDSASSPNRALNGHRNRDRPTSGPTEKIPTKIKEKEKRIRWTREDYFEVMYAFYLSLEKPSGSHTENTYNIWRSRNPDIRPNIDSNKLANTRRDILKNKRLLDVELSEVKERVRKDIREETINSNARMIDPENLGNGVLDDIPVDEVSDEDIDFQQARRNGIHYDDVNSNNNQISPHIQQKSDKVSTDDTLVENIGSLPDDFDFEEFETLKEEIVLRIEDVEDKPFEERENLVKVCIKKSNEKIIKMANYVIEEICSGVDLDLTDLNIIIYATAKTIEARLGIRPKKKRKHHVHKKPRWQMKIDKEIEDMRCEISILTEIENGNNPKTRKSRKLKRKFNLKNHAEIPVLKEELKQKMQAKAQRLRRFEKRSKFYRQNKTFESDAKKFYREIGNKQINVDKVPDKEDIENFWGGIWGKEKHFNEDADWIDRTTEKYEGVQQQDWNVLTVDELKQALIKSQKWKSPGTDKVTNFWLNSLSSTHVTLTKLLNDVVESPETSPPWLCQGTTYLLPKSKTTEESKNYRPITCLSTTYKLLTSILSERTYKHLDENDLLPLEQKGCRKGSYGCKDQLLINKMILENCKTKLRNMSCAWIDYRKAFDSVPHDWILRSLDLCKASPILINFLKESMKQWQTKLLLTHQSGTITCENLKIRRGIFQGDSLSPLLFCISLIPLSLELNNSGYGYKIGNDKFSHLFYMDDLKLYGKDDNEIEGLLRIVKGFSDDIGMEFGLDKCAKATFRKGKLRKKDNIILNDVTVIKDLEQEEVYKYLGVNEGDGIQHASMKDKIRKEVIRRVRSILKTELNSKNRITAINTLAVPVITYSFNIINWNLNEIKKLDTKIRKLLTMYNMHHPKADVDRLYLPRSSGGRGMIQLELSYRTSTIGLYRYLDLSQDWMMQRAFQHESVKKLHSVVELEAENGLKNKELLRNCSG